MKWPHIFMFVFLKFLTLKSLSLSKMLVWYIAKLIKKSMADFG